MLLSRWTCLLLSTTLISIAARVPVPERLYLSSRQAQALINVTHLSSDTLRYNGYEIDSCGDPSDTKSKANLLLGFLSQMKPKLEQVIADAQQGLRSQHGYAAFFKSNLNIRKVVRTFEELVDAHPIIVY